MTDTAFTWLTVHPDHWLKQELHGHQTCKLCNRDMAVEGVLSTNARGAWEHFECAAAEYHAVHAALQAPDQYGTQREMIEAVQASPRQQFVVVYLELDRGRSQRWGWRPTGTSST